MQKEMNESWLKVAVWYKLHLSSKKFVHLLSLIHTFPWVKNGKGVATYLGSFAVIFAILYVLY